jgi:hypothetical protein
VLAGLGARAKSCYASGRFAAVDDGAAVFVLPEANMRRRCEEIRPEVESALAARFGFPVPLLLVTEADAPAPQLQAPGPRRSQSPGFTDVEVLSRADVMELPDASTRFASAHQRLLEKFPGSEEVL